MAKLSELTALTGANVASTDLLLVADTSVATSKKITAAEMQNYLSTAFYPQVGLFTNIGSVNVPTGTTVIRSTGYSTAGRGPATYVNDATADATLATNHPRMCKQSGDGRYWRLLPDPYINVLAAGAVGNDSTDCYAAIQACIDYGVEVMDGGTIYFPAGDYVVSDSPLIYRTKSLNLLGEGNDKTTIKASGDDKPAIRTRGYWRSVVQGIGFWCSNNDTGGAFELDGDKENLGDLFGAQQCTFIQCTFYGGYNSKYAFTVGRWAGAYGQGSENNWYQCQFVGTENAANTALLLINGTNALQNTCVGCNFQGFVTGVLVASGAVDILHCGFQSTYGYDQIVNGGWDMECSNIGLGDTITMTGCRTESLRVYKGGGCPAQISQFAYNPGIVSWTRNNNTAYGLNYIYRGTTAAGNLKVYRVTTAGTSGGSEPTWPESGTVTDGTITWTQLNYNVFENIDGVIRAGSILYGQVGCDGVHQVRLEDVAVTRDDLFDGSSFISSDRAPSWRRLRRAVGAGDKAIITGNNTASGARTTKTNVQHVGKDTLIWNQGGPVSVTYFDIGIGRGTGDHLVKVKNNFEVKGGWGFEQVTFSEVNGNNPGRNGVVYFVTDGTPGSSPLTGSGSGCLAVYQNSAWKAIS